MHVFQPLALPAVSFSTKYLRCLGGAASASGCPAVAQLGAAVVLCAWMEAGEAACCEQPHCMHCRYEDWDCQSPEWNRQHMRHEYDRMVTELQVD